MVFGASGALGGRVPARRTGADARVPGADGGAPRA